MDRLVWVLAVVVAAGVGLLAFVVGDRRRRRAAGAAGPRPCPSVGEALRRVPRPRGRVLVVFLGEDPASVATGAALAEDPRLMGLLDSDGLQHVIVRVAREGREVAEALLAKYGGRPTLPAGPSALLLDAKGQSLGVVESGEEPLTARLEALIGGPAAAAAGGDDPVAKE